MIERPVPAESPDPRETKLPRWAQKSLADLRRALRDERGRAEEARLATRPDETNTVIQPYASIPIGLPRDVPVRFRLDGDRLGSWLDVRADGPLAVLHGGGPFRILPRSSNSAYLEVCR